jgi:hypothetical protein
MRIMTVTPRHSVRRGNVVVLTAVCLTVIMSVVALTLDGGTLLNDRRQAQAVADAAALAAASDLYYNFYTNNGTDPNHTARDSALATAAANGFANDGTVTSVQVNIPPLYGPFAGMAEYAEVIVQYNRGRMFSSIFGSSNIAVTARAVAIGSPIAAEVGIMVLDPTAKGAFSANGGGGTTVTGTPIIVNSNSPEASIAGGGGVVSAPEIYVTGGATTTGGGSYSGTVLTGRPPQPDPLANLPVPDPTTMTQQANKKTQYTQGDVTLNPGVYTGGISVSGTANLTLTPGIYYMDGGGFGFSGQGSLTGHGVMIYNAPGKGNSGGISISGLGSIDISAPTSGPYSGLTFFQDRTSTQTGNVSGTGGATSITGTFYFAGALLNVNGNGGVSNVGSQYISDQLSLGGSGGIDINWTPTTVAKQRNLYLVE